MFVLIPDHCTVVLEKKVLSIFSMCSYGSNPSTLGWGLVEQGPLGTATYQYQVTEPSSSGQEEFIYILFTNRNFP